MTVPVTVIGSAVACFLLVEFGCANAKGASSKQARATTVFFIICLPVAVVITFPLLRDSGARAARNLDFPRRLLFFSAVLIQTVAVNTRVGNGCGQSYLFLRPTGAWCSRPAEARPKPAVNLNNVQPSLVAQP